MLKLLQNVLPLMDGFIVAIQDTMMKRDTSTL